MQNYNEVELSALGMGNYFNLLSFFYQGVPTRGYTAFSKTMILVWVSNKLVCCEYIYNILWNFCIVKSSSKQEYPVILTIFISAIGTVVTVAEILKNNGLAAEKSIIQNLREKIPKV
jgi:hypothetical protein